MLAAVIQITANVVKLSSFHKAQFGSFTCFAPLKQKYPVRCIVEATTHYALNRASLLVNYRYKYNYRPRDLLEATELLLEFVVMVVIGGAFLALWP